MAIDWATVIATLASGAIGAGGAVLGVWLTTRSTRKLNEENRAKDKKQELIVSLDFWESLLADLQSHIKYGKVNRAEHTLEYFSPFLAKLNLCFFLMEEYNFVSKPVRNDYFNLSNLIIYLYASPKKLFIEHLERMKEWRDINFEDDNKMEILIDSLLKIEKPNDTDGWLQYKKEALSLIVDLFESIQYKLNEELLKR